MRTRVYIGPIRFTRTVSGSYIYSGAKGTYRVSGAHLGHGYEWSIFFQGANESRNLYAASLRSARELIELMEKGEI